MQSYVNLAIKSSSWVQWNTRIKSLCISQLARLAPWRMWKYVVFPTCPGLVGNESLSDIANLRVCKLWEVPLRVARVVEPLLSRRAQRVSLRAAVYRVARWLMLLISFPPGQNPSHLLLVFFPKVQQHYAQATIQVNGLARLKRTIFYPLFPSWLGSWCFWLCPLTPCQNSWYNLAVPHDLPDRVKTHFTTQLVLSRLVRSVWDHRTGLRMMYLQMM